MADDFAFNSKKTIGPSPWTGPRLKRNVQDVLYHGTEAKRVPSILKHGLNTSLPASEGDHQRYVFLATHPGTAKEFALGRGTRGAVLEIKAPKSNRYRTDIGEFTRSVDRIPAKNIKLKKFVDQDD